MGFGDVVCASYLHCPLYHQEVSATIDPQCSAAKGAPSSCEMREHHNDSFGSRLMEKFRVEPQMLFDADLSCYGASSLHTHHSL